MRLLRAFGGAGALVVAAIVGGTLISGVLAAPATPATDATAVADDAEGTYCQAYLDALANELGISSDELTTAGRAAAATTIDAAVAAGDLTEERATALKERLAASAGEGCGLLGGWHHPGRRGGPGGPGGPGMLPFGDLLGTAADSLGIDQAALVERFRAGETLADIASAEGVDVATVTAAVSDALDSALADAVAAGDLTQARADEIAAHIATELADGTWPDRPGRGHGPHAADDAPDAEASPAA
ncbi:MAG: hypothetical protein ABI622_00910 [Chloroflexota bacterium]